MLSDFAGAMDGGNDLGSLADELAEAWDEYVEGEEEVSGLQMDEHCGYAPLEILEPQHQNYENISSPADTRTTNGFSSPQKFTDPVRARRRRRLSEGSDYSDDPDLEPTSTMSHALEARIAIMEELARQETDETGPHADGVVQRVVDGLKDLGAQSSVENTTTRSVLPLHDLPKASLCLSNTNLDS